MRAIADAGSTAIIVPWLHPVMTPPYRYLLSRPPAAVKRVVICHNVLPHDALRGGAAMTRAILSRADVLVTHAPHMRAEIAGLGLAGTPIVEAFLPRFAADEFAPPPPAAVIAAERERLGSPGSCSCCSARFGHTREPISRSKRSRGSTRRSA